MTSINLQGGQSIALSGSNQNAVIDTGTTLIGGPRTLLDQLYSQIPNARAGADLSSSFTDYYLIREYIFNSSLNFAHTLIAETSSLQHPNNGLPHLRWHPVPNISPRLHNRPGFEHLLSRRVLRPRAQLRLVADPWPGQLEANLGRRRLVPQKRVHRLPRRPRQRRVCPAQCDLGCHRVRGDGDLEWDHYHCQRWW
jgi:hypothetical protein